MKGFYNLTNDVVALSSYLKEHDLTIVDSDNKIIFYFIVNKSVSQHFRRWVNYNETERPVANKIDASLRSGSRYARRVNKRALNFQEKVAYVDEFMKMRAQSTAYLYKELQRIKSTRVVKDGLRKMISFIQQPEHQWVKKKVFKCFIDARKKVWRPHIVYGTGVTNDLTFNKDR